MLSQWICTLTVLLVESVVFFKSSWCTLTLQTQLHNIPNRTARQRTAVQAQESCARVAKKRTLRSAYEFIAPWHSRCWKQGISDNSLWCWLLPEPRPAPDGPELLHSLNDARLKGGWARVLCKPRPRGS